VFGEIFEQIIIRTSEVLAWQTEKEAEEIMF
jgi:hypothetical protein